MLGENHLPDNDTSEKVQRRRHGCGLVTELWEMYPAMLLREDLFPTALSQGSVHSAGSQRCAKNQDKTFKSRIALKIPTAAQRGYFNSCLTILFQETKVPHAI